MSNLIAGTSYSGGLGMKVYTATVLASGLRLYAKTGMKPNSAWTPTAMIRKANELTGHVYRRGQYNMAAAALTELAAKLAPEARRLGQIS